MRPEKNKLPALFNLGFRPFFLGASVFAVLTVTLWLAVYALSMPLPTGVLTISQWHAHEMIYGYGMAIIAGFLLTTVKKWTGIRTMHGKSLALAGCFALWIMARLLFMPGAPFIGLAAFFDLVFVFCLVVPVIRPIVRTRNWRQIGVLFQVLLLAAGNVSFYLGTSGILPHGIYWGIYGGLYAVIGLILLMGNRFIPGFIERGVGYPVQLFNSRGLALASLLLFPAFLVAEVFLPGRMLAGYLAAALFIVNVVQLCGWHTPGIWKKPLLWGLYIASIFIALGFLLSALNVFAGVSGFLAVHAFGYGGIGMITMSMMGRVALGLTGKSVHHPPRLLGAALLVLTAGAIIRVGMPLVAVNIYMLWITLSQIFWIIAFVLFTIAYAPFLYRPRPDGQPG